MKVVMSHHYGFIPIIRKCQGLFNIGNDLSILGLFVNLQRDRNNMFTPSQVNGGLLVIYPIKKYGKAFLVIKSGIRSYGKPEQVIFLLIAIVPP